MIVQNPSSKSAPRPGPSKVKVPRSDRSILSRDRTVVSRSKRREIEAERREINYQNNILMKQKRDEIVLRFGFSNPRIFSLGQFWLRTVLLEL